MKISTWLYGLALTAVMFMSGASFAGPTPYPGMAPTPAFDTVAILDTGTGDLNKAVADITVVETAVYSTTKPNNDGVKHAIWLRHTSADSPKGKPPYMVINDNQQVPYLACGGESEPIAKPMKVPWFLV